jgi:3-methyladenine DNA glycosylase AlkD
MNALALRDEIICFCKANADEAIVKKYSIYFKEGHPGYDAYGVTTPLILGKVKELNNNNSVTLPVLLEAAPFLVKSGKQEENLILLLLVEKRLKDLKSEDFETISQWYAYGILNWSLCDCLCNKITPWFFQKNLIPLEKLAEWQISPYKFQRRSVPVLLIKLLKTTNDYRPFFDLVAPLMMDTERVVHQGLGWFLREAWKKQPEQTEQFLLLWKDQSARLIFQYATEKMSTEEKGKFRRHKNI